MMPLGISFPRDISFGFNNRKEMMCVNARNSRNSFAYGKIQDSKGTNFISTCFNAENSRLGVQIFLLVQMWMLAHIQSLDDYNFRIAFSVQTIVMLYFCSLKFTIAQFQSSLCKTIGKRRQNFPAFNSTTPLEKISLKPTKLQKILKKYSIQVFQITYTQKYLSYQKNYIKIQKRFNINQIYESQATRICIFFSELQEQVSHFQK